jgi:hypothetical protein
VKRKIAALFVLLLVSAMATSGTAPWFRWRNQVDRTIMCSQNPPGNAWELMDGPYMDSRCRKQGKPQ